VPDGPVVSRIAGSLGETEDLDQPVHGRAGIRVEKIRNDRRIWVLLRHGSDFTPALAGLLRPCFADRAVAAVGKYAAEAQGQEAGSGSDRSRQTAQVTGQLLYLHPLA